MASSVDEFDIIVAGAGSAGCVLANRLSANRAIRVVLLEAGARDWYPWIHVPVGYFKTLHNPLTDWRYRTEPGRGSTDEGSIGRADGGSAARALLTAAYTFGANRLNRPGFGGASFV